MVRTAHQVGIRTSSTIMFGHLDSFGAWARHLLHLRALQAETRGFTEFVPLPFVHMQTPVYLAGAAHTPASAQSPAPPTSVICVRAAPRHPFCAAGRGFEAGRGGGAAGRARRGPTLSECRLMHAVARLALHPLLTNIQATTAARQPSAVPRCSPAASFRQRWLPLQATRHPFPKSEPPVSIVGTLR